MNKSTVFSGNSEFTATSHLDDFESEFAMNFNTPDRISRIVKQVKRDKQKQKDNELWEQYCEQQNMVVSITGSYVVKDSHPTILLPKNTTHNSLFQSGAITIISNDNLEENVSNTDTNVSSYNSYTDNSLKPIDENDQEHLDEDIILKMNEVNTQKNVNQNSQVKANMDSPGDSHVENEANFLLSSREIAVATKLRLLRTKINTALDAIAALWDFEPDPDGEEDLARRQKRASEFESRFSRNYLYHLGRQMAEIHKLLKNTSPRFVERNSSQNIFQKISNAHTIILQGLSAYQKHLPSSIPGGLPDKLNDLLVHSCDLWRVCNKCELLKPVLYNPGLNEVFIEHIDGKCKNLLQKIRIDHEKKIKLEQKPSSNQVIQKKSPKKVDKRNKLSNRLSMYTLETPYILKQQQAFWKKSLNHLSKPKFITKPKLKKSKKLDDKSSSKVELTVNYLNPCMSQESIPMKKKKSEIICVPPKEDEIITQMDILNQRESSKNSDGNHSKHSDQSEEMSKEEFNDTLRPLLLEILQNIDNKDSLEEEKTSMVELKNILTEIKQVTVPECNSSDIDIPDQLTLHKNRSKTTITGPKNAKLICLSPVESENEDFPESPAPCQTVATSTSDTELKKTCIDSPTQTRPSDVKKPISNLYYATPRKEVKTVKFQKQQPKIMKINMPKSIIRNLNKYKDAYANHTRKNSMYVVKKNRKPWEIVSKISDNLLDNMISDVVSELEIDNLLMKLCDMEFQ